ncbi:MAG: hypothetical protein IT160_14615 [Bryobacterales bacterium]|nr:hypothetical protein [Bryobacterales bacterium]
MRVVFLSLICFAAFAAEPSLDIPVHLAGTRAFTLSRDWREQQRQQILNYLDRRIERTAAERAANWNRPDQKAILRRMLGVAAHAGAAATINGNELAVSTTDGFEARANLHGTSTKAITIVTDSLDPSPLESNDEMVVSMVTVPPMAGPQIASITRRLPDATQRSVLTRLAVVAGRTLPGLEVEQTLAVADALKRKYPSARIQLYGGYTALLAAAISNLAVIRASARNPEELLYGQLHHFTGAEIAALVAPRKLALEAEAGDFGRAQSYYRIRGAGGALTSTGPAKQLAPVINAANYAFLHGYLRKLIDRSESVRYHYWNLTGAADPGAKAAQLRTELARWMGVPAEPAAPLNPRTNLLRVTAHFTAYEVQLGALDGVDVYGHLLIPRRRNGLLPAIVCQHGLGGQPKDITGVGENPDPSKVYHQFGARLAEQGFVVFAPYLTVPTPQRELINPIVRKAASLGMLRTALEVRKLRRVVDFLQTLPYVDGNHIGYYGLSYGGYSTIWMGPLETRLKTVIISGHFNDWRPKITDENATTSYLLHPDEDFFNWNVLNRFTHPELIAAMYPRAVMVEFADHDATTTPAWHERAWKQVEEISRAWHTEDRVQRDAFLAAHEIGGMRTFDFANRWLKPAATPERTYTYTVWPTMRDANGIGDSDDDSLPYISTILTTITNPFSVGAGTPAFNGFALRVSRYDHPSALVVRYGTRPGAGDLGTARLKPDSIQPLFDLWYDARIPTVRLAPGRTYYVSLAEASPDPERGHYVLYGRRPLGGKPRPQDFPFAYRSIAPRKGEDTFAFVRTYLERPSPPVFEHQLAAAGDVISLQGAPWKIVNQAPAAEQVVPTAIAGFERFLNSCCKVRLSDSASRDIVVEVKPSVDGVTTEEGFSVIAAPGEVRVSATTPRGVMRGLYWIEDEIRSRQSAALPAGRTVRNARFPVRITTSIYIGGLRYTESSRPFIYTPGLFERISRDGFNGVWIWLNVEEAAGHLSVFQELEDPQASRRLARIQELTQLGKKYGVDVWVYLATNYNHPVPESFYQKYPETRGIGYNNAMCTSDARVRQYQADVVRNIVSQAPGIAGFVVIYDSEGFYYCGNHDASRRRCPRCSKSTCVDLALQVLTNINGAMHQAGGPSKRLIAFSYGRNDEWVKALFPRLPKDITLQVDFSKGGIVERDGVRHQTGDYNLTLIGPPQEFIDHHQLAEQLGLRFITKTEHAVSQEFIFAPYIPAMNQWLRRIEKIREYSADGWFGNWCHYGYLVSLPAQLFTRMSFDPAPPAAEVLPQLARNYYGHAAVPYVLRAWQHFSDGIRQFPYSDNVARLPGPLQKGPSNPFYLDASTPASGRWRAWQNDLKWTAPWGSAIAAKYLGIVRDQFHQGIAELAQAQQAATEPDHKRAIAGEWRIARTIESSLDSILNEIAWIEARDAHAPVARMREILLKERANVIGILPILDSDSRLGYASEGGGIIRGGLFTPELVRWKLGLLDDALARGLLVSELSR